MRARSILAVLLLSFALACGGGSGSGGSTPTGNLTLRFGSDSFPGYDQAWVSVEKVEASTNGSTWMALGNVQASYDLMTLQNGHSAVMLSNIAVPPATYTQFRITWATQNYANPINLAAYVVPTGASKGQPLSMPTTTVLPGSVTVTSGGSTTAQLMLSGQQAIQQRAGVSPPYTFQATGQAYDLAQAASITGKLTDGTSPLVGAEVYAETVDGFGVATLLRRAFTDGTGSYLLECLPASASTAYFVVAQPGNATSAYPAQVSAPVNVTASPSPVNLAFSGAAQPGSLTLTLTPPSTSSQGTWGELRQGLSPAPGLSYQLIVRSQGAVTGASQDQVYFTGLAPSSYYGVTAQRSTSGATPTTVVYNGQLLVASGATTPLTLSF